MADPEAAMRATRRIPPSLTLTFLLAALIAGPCAVFAQTTPGQVPLLPPGIHDQMFERDAEPRVRYAISIPKGYAPSRPVPLVLALHFGGNPHGAALGLLKVLVAPAFEELGAVIVAPETTGGAWSSPANERAVTALLDAIEARYAIDRRRVAVTGFSMGGAGTWHFAGRFPDRFSAAVPVAGRPPASLDGWKTPVLAVHSRQDEVVPIEPAEARIGELRKAGVRAEMVVVTGIAHYETARFAEPLRRAVRWLRDTWK